MKKVTFERITVEKPNGVCLDLTHEEARVLMIILSKVGGHPSHTLRGYQSSIFDALENAGYKYTSADMVAIDGGLTFSRNLLGMSPTEPPSTPILR